MEAESLFQLKVMPDSVFIQQGRGSQRLSLDFSIQSQQEDAWILQRIDLQVYGLRGHLLLKRRIDAQAASPSIGTVPQRTLPAQGTLDLFNPFPPFEEQLSLHRLHYSFRLTAEQDREVTLTTDVFPRSYAQQVRLALPLKGRILVDDGNDYLSHHRRVPLHHPGVQAMGMRTNEQRYAWDLVLIDEIGADHCPDSSHNEDYFGFGATVYAPGDGTVIGVCNDVQDNQPYDLLFTPDDFAANPSLSRGNCILISHGAEEYSLLAHCQQGSVAVEVGDFVQQGQAIAALGNSGWTSYPHLHYQLTHGAEWKTAAGLPARFLEFELVVGSDTLTIVDGYPDTGEIIIVA